MIRLFLRLHILLLIALLVSCNSGKEEKVDQLNHPNVVLILTDDQGWGDLGIHGNDKISTPTIDQMATRGAQFGRFYVSPLCAPTRASLLSGRYYLRTGTSWVSKGLENMRSSEITIAELFKEQGYKTGCFGKWHNGAHFPEHPNQQGFDEFIGFCAGHWNNYFNTTLEHNGEAYPTQGYITDVLTDEAIKFIEQNREDPFFCYIPFNAPHGPFQVPDQYFDKYKTLGFNDKDATIYGMCENIDDNVQRLFDKIHQLELDENTIIIFMTDNGPNGERYNGGMRGIKGSIHEGGVRVPCFINWKGKIEPKSIEAIAAHIDILPTLTSLCKLQLPEKIQLDGMDLSALLLTDQTKLEERLYYTKKSTEFIEPDGAVRSDQYRLVMDEGDTMLFDMKVDPGEKNDLSSIEEETKNALAKSYNSWFQDIKDQFKSDDEIKIGFDHEKEIYLPAHEAAFSGDIHFKEGHGWAHDWLVNWVNTTDSIYWDVVVNESANYELTMLYCCPEDKVGSEISAYCKESTLNSNISQAHNPPYVQSNDRVVRMEVYEKEWAKLPMGKLHISHGNQSIVLHASHIPNGEVGEIKGIELTKVKPE